MQQWHSGKDTQKHMHAEAIKHWSTESPCTWQWEWHSMTLNMSKEAQGSLWQDVFKFMPALMLLWSSLGQKQRRSISQQFLNTLHNPWSICVFTNMQAGFKICIFQPNYHHNHCNVSVQSWFIWELTYRWRSSDMCMHGWVWRGYCVSVVAQWRSA